MILEKMKKELELKITDAKTAMKNSEADGNSDYDYHEGRYEAYSYALSLLVYLKSKEK